MRAATSARTNARASRAWPPAASPPRRAHAVYVAVRRRRAPPLALRMPRGARPPACDTARREGGAPMLRMSKCPLAPSRAVIGRGLARVRVRGPTAHRSCAPRDSMYVENSENPVGVLGRSLRGERVRLGPRHCGTRAKLTRLRLVPTRARQAASSFRQARPARRLQASRHRRTRRAHRHARCSRRAPCSSASLRARSRRRLALAAPAARIASHRRQRVCAATAEASREASTQWYRTRCARPRSCACSVHAGRWLGPTHRGGGGSRAAGSTPESCRRHAASPAVVR